MIGDMELVAVTGAFAGVGSYGAARYLSSKFIHMGITGKDIHKPGQPITAEMGGLAVLVGLVLGSAVFLAVETPLPSLFLAGVVTVMASALVGVADDITDMRQRYKPFLVAATSLPLIWALWQRTYITVPMIGQMHLGLAFPLLVVPFAVTIASNFTNMLAGFNGLEAGTASIAIGTLAFLAAMQGSYGAAILGVILLCAFLGFLRLNWYPARIFPGDTGSLLAGAGIATIALSAGLEFAAIMVSIPAGIDFTLKLIAKRPFAGRHEYGNTTVDEDGYLKPPGYPALVHAFMRTGPTTERGLVMAVLGMQATYAVLAVVLTLGLGRSVL
jgi:UDP-N-acetylglucosamine--dolichyl-phosphate N-acetylglucosaminephosphotransferase